MSSYPRQKGAAPAYDDAEKGTHDASHPQQVTFPADVKKDPFAKAEKEVFTND